MRFSLGLGLGPLRVSQRVGVPRVGSRRRPTTASKTQAITPYNPDDPGKRFEIAVRDARWADEERTWQHQHAALDEALARVANRDRVTAAWKAGGGFIQVCDSKCFGRKWTLHDERGCFCCKGSSCRLIHLDES